LVSDISPLTDCYQVFHLWSGCEWVCYRGVLGVAMLIVAQEGP